MTDAEPEPEPIARALRIIVALVVLGFIGLLGYGLAAQAPETTIDDALATKRAVSAPAFDLEVLEGGRLGPLAPAWDRAAADGRVKLSELRGTPLVLNFWASWCDPCREEAPVLRKGWEAARQRGVLFVGLDIQDVRQDARRFVKELGQDYPQLRDPDKTIGRAYGITGIPETYFVSRRGRVVGHVIGVVTERQLQAGIEAAIAGRPTDARRGGDQRPTG